MDLNRLLFQHQLAAMAQSGQIAASPKRPETLEHYARLIEDFRHREGISEALLMQSSELAALKTASLEGQRV